MSGSNLLNRSAQNHILILSLGNSVQFAINQFG